VQYNFLPYDEMVLHGVPEEYRVLILPACYALSDVEAQRIADFCRRGGTVVADFACGLFDHHGKGRTRGALDEMFGVVHDGSETAGDLFGDRLWVETNQDAAYHYQRYRDLFATIDCRLKDGFTVAERKLDRHTVRRYGDGTAVYVNLSPQRYLLYREEGTANDAHRRVFIQHVLASVEPWVTVTGPDGQRPTNIEVTYWRQGDRTLVFVIQNEMVTGSALGGDGSEGVVDQKTPIQLGFAGTVHDVVDERTGRKLGDGKRFAFDFNKAEAVMLSFEGSPPRGSTSAD
jgi:hypothetical protein